MPDSPVHGGGDEGARGRNPADALHDELIDGAGERADAIPENALTAALNAYDRFGDVESQSDHAAAMTVALAAALRAAQPEAGSEEAERLKAAMRHVLGAMALAPNDAAARERAGRLIQQALHPEVRAAHPEADRAPEGEPSDETMEVHANLARHAERVLRPDRAPGEVETAAGVTLRQFLTTGDGCYLDNADGDTLRDMVRLLAAGGQSRDDTAALAEVTDMLDAMERTVAASDLDSHEGRGWRLAVSGMRARLARFGGAGRAESEDR